MSLLLLLKPNGVAVIPPPPPEAAPVVTGSKRTPPPQLLHFPAGTARIFFRAIAADLLLLPDFKRATLSLSARSSDLQIDLEPQITKHDLELTYRAIRDEPEVDDEFRRLVEAAYLLTR